jgi:uncharacterized protein (TIGR02594 family)
MDVAMGEMGIKARKGARSNPSVLKYLKACDPRFADDGALNDDETDWCSAFVNWCLAEVGIPGTMHTRARSWLRWGLGMKLTEPRLGAITVFTRSGDKSLKERGKGHVAFLWTLSGTRVYVLGGNQGRKVSIKHYKLTNVLGYYWPNQLALVPKTKIGYLVPPSKLYP